MGMSMTFICTEFERIQRENKLLNDNLTATQARCTALLEEARRLRASAPPVEARNVYTEIVFERARQDAKWGEQNHPSVVDAALSADERCGYYEIPTEARAKLNCDTEHQIGNGTYASIAVEELSEAVSARDDAERRVELIQLAAVVVGWIGSVDRKLKAAKAEATP